MPVIALHPGIADSYREQVEKLSDALASKEARQEARTAIRNLIDRIVLTPAKQGRGVDIEIEGRLAAIVALATGNRTDFTPPTLSVERAKGTRQYRRLRKARV